MSCEPAMQLTSLGGALNPLVTEIIRTVAIIIELPTKLPMQISSLVVSSAKQS